MITSNENDSNKYARKVDKSRIPTCNIMGVNIAAINMEWLLEYLDVNLKDLSGDYICVSNVYIAENDFGFCGLKKFNV